ncbi:MFS transporter, partial [Pauljensenia sp. UMB0018B]|nr:MFS transporter [Pauljensenia sp. UMB0018B]
GFLIETLGPTNGWRSSFLFNLPLGIIGVIAAFRLLPFGKERRHFMGAKKVKSDASESKTNLPAEQANASQATQKIDLDPVGIVLLSLAVLCIMLPFMSHGH